MTCISRKTEKVSVLDKVFCICYSAQIQKDKKKNFLALLDSRSMINMMILAYLAQQGLKMQKIDIGT